MEWQKEGEIFDAIAAYDWTFNFLVLPDGSESMEGMWVTETISAWWSSSPCWAARLWSRKRRDHAAPVIILGYELWQRKFNGDPNIIGKTIRISRQDTPPTVIGVMPPASVFFRRQEPRKEPNYNLNALVDFWIPAPRTRRAERGVLECGGAVAERYHAAASASGTHGDRRKAGASRTRL